MQHVVCVCGDRDESRACGGGGGDGGAAHGYDAVHDAGALRVVDIVLGCCRKASLPP